MATLFKYMAPRRIDDVEAVVGEDAQIWDIRTKRQVNAGVDANVLKRVFGDRYHYAADLAGTTALGKWQPPDPQKAAAAIQRIVAVLQGGTDVVIVGTRRTATECGNLIENLAGDVTVVVVDGRRRFAVYGADKSPEDAILEALDAQPDVVPNEDFPGQRRRGNQEMAAPLRVSAPQEEETPPLQVREPRRRAA